MAGRALSGERFKAGSQELKRVILKAAVVQDPVQFVGVFLPSLGAADFDQAVKEAQGQAAVFILENGAFRAPVPMAPGR